MLSDRRSQHLATPLLPIPPPHSSYSIGGHISSCKREEKNYVKILTFHTSSIYWTVPTAVNTMLQHKIPDNTWGPPCWHSTAMSHFKRSCRCHRCNTNISHIPDTKRSRTSIQRCFQSEETTLATNAMIKLFLPTGKCSVSCSVWCLLIIHEMDKNHKSKHHGGWGGSTYTPPAPTYIFMRCGKWEVTNQSGALWYRVFSIWLYSFPHGIEIRDSITFESVLVTTFGLRIQKYIWCTEPFNTTD